MKQDAVFTFLTSGPHRWAWYPLTCWKVYVSGIGGRCVSSEHRSTVKLKLLYWAHLHSNKSGEVLWRLSFTWRPNCLKVQTFQNVSFCLCVNQEHWCARCMHVTEDKGGTSRQHQELRRLLGDMCCWRATFVIVLSGFAASMCKQVAETHLFYSPRMELIAQDGSNISDCWPGVLAPAFSVILVDLCERAFSKAKIMWQRCHVKVAKGLTALGSSPHCCVCAQFQILFYIYLCNKSM